MIHLNALPPKETPSQERQTLLQEIVDHVALQRTVGKVSNLIFICTHNSRRSHLAAIWAQVAAAYYDVQNVTCWSGGTETTAFNPNAIASLERSGFSVHNPGGENPHYALRTSEDSEPIICFSKVFNDAHNPQEDVAAVMVCDHAEQNCPFIPGALVRIGLPYQDPKEADGTPEESAVYDARSAEIASEMFWVFSQLRNGQE